MITIFTPVYNQANIIGQLYQSLLRQTSYEFEWLIVDDGSTDYVKEVVEPWIKKTREFEIRFYQQKNGGKHRAINYGAKIAKYDAFFVVDSDDYLEDDAVETILKYWDEIKRNPEFAGLAGTRRTIKGELIGNKICFEEFLDATNLERDKYQLNGDKAEVYKTQYLCQFPFPEYEDERFLTEAIVLNKIAYSGYKIRWLNKSFIVCNYLEDGLTAMEKQLFIDNPKGWAHYIRMEREYGIIDKKNYLRNCYDFYQFECGKIDDGEIKKLLRLNDAEYLFIKEQFVDFYKKITELCANKTICLYAYGKWGIRLATYLKELEIFIDYVIDKRYKQIKDIPAFSIDMDLPQVDVVMIALNEHADEVGQIARKKMPEADIIFLRDIVPELW